MSGMIVHTCYSMTQRGVESQRKNWLHTAMTLSHPPTSKRNYFSKWGVFRPPFKFIKLSLKSNNNFSFIT